MPENKIQRARLAQECRHFAHNTWAAGSLSVNLWKGNAALTNNREMWRHMASIDRLFIPVHVSFQPTRPKACPTCGTVNYQCDRCAAMRAG